MTAGQVFGWLLIIVGGLLTLTIVGAIFGIPMIIVGIPLASGSNNRTNVTHQVNVLNYPALQQQPFYYQPGVAEQKQYALGDVVNGHRLEWDGAQHRWAPLTSATCAACKTGAVLNVAPSALGELCADHMRRRAYLLEIERGDPS
ncbi:MAG: DUF5362 family protein [Candidatus Nanopelagicales bacterium]